MLYINRCFNGNLYGVFDTDDGVEEVVSDWDIGNYCDNLGLEIRGILYSCVPGASRYVERIEVYQPPETLSQRQLKIKMIHGVDVLTWDGMVTSIRYDATPVPKPIRIRLSDFGSECADCILHNAKNIGFHKITLVLDDKISILQRTFDFMDDDDIYEGKDGIGVAIDVREMTDDKMVELAYSSFIHDAYHDLSDSIIDFPERKKRIMSIIP